ncbi:MAG: glycosyl transferase family protein [Chloroflexi bacterium]|nr:glycosyl transferase family protein [Chloroflexota bacterium]
MANGARETGFRDRPSISAVVITCNEAEVIESCLMSVKSWVDEIVAVDMHSTDGTREIVERYADTVIEYDRLTYADPLRNFAFSRASGDWILMLDPDERVPAPLANELQQVAKAGEVDVVQIPRQQVLFGRIARSPGASDGSHPRFFRRGTIDWPPNIHGSPNLSGLKTYEIPASRADLSILHDTWRSVPIVLDKIYRYAPNDVTNLQAKGESFSLGSMIGAAHRQFVGRMVDGRAYEDGMPGLLTAIYFAIYHLTIHAELWEAEGRPTSFDWWIRKWGLRFAQCYKFLRFVRRILHRSTRHFDIIARPSNGRLKPVSLRSKPR